MTTLIVQLSDADVARIARAVARELAPTPTPRTVPQAATALGVSKRSVHRMVRDGRLGSIKVGGRLLIPAEAIERAQREGVAC